MTSRSNQPRWAQADVSALWRAFSCDEYERGYIVHGGNFTKNSQNFGAVDRPTQGPAGVVRAARDGIKETIECVDHGGLECDLICSLFGLYCCLHRDLQVCWRDNLGSCAHHTTRAELRRDTPQQARRW